MYHISKKLIQGFRLRRAVLHPYLVLGAPENSKTFSGTEIDDVNDMITRFTAEGVERAEGDDEGERSTIKKSPGSEPTYAQEVLNNLNSEDGFMSECPICLDMMEMPMLLPRCLHKW